MNQALDLPPGPDALVVVRISPSFEPDRTLSLLRQRGGTYVLRSTRLAEHVWSKMMDEMQSQQGSVIRLDDTHQAAALARVATAKVVHERPVDWKTAHMFLELWRLLGARAQIVHEVGIRTAKLDGTFYRVWYRGKIVVTHSPRAGSVLNEAISSAERLYSLVENEPPDTRALLSVALDEMQVALQRTQGKEPCLRPLSETSN